MNFTPRTNPLIVHEAETQRQHARYHIPLEVIHQGQRYGVADWSVSGFALRDVSLDLTKGAIEQFTLVFPFDTYELTLVIEAEIRYNDRVRRRIGVKFLNLNARQINVIRYVLEAFLSGEIVEAGDILEVTARNVSSQSRAVPAVAGPVSMRDNIYLLTRRFVTWGLLVAIAFGVIVFLAASLYEKSFVVQASSAMIAGNSYILSSPSDGLISDIKPGASLKPGDKVYDVVSKPGETVSVASVCTCSIREVYAANGTYVREGDKVASVLEPNSKQYIEALIERAELTRLYGDIKVNVRLIDGTLLTNAKIRKYPSLLGREGSVELLAVEIDPGISLPSNMIGRPVIVNFDESRRSIVGRALSVLALN